MSEELEQHNDGTWSGLKKTIVGTLGTIVTAGGAYLGTTLFGGHEDKAEPVATQQAAPVINLNVANNNTNQSNSVSNGGGGKTLIIREKETNKEKPAAEKQAPVKKKENSEYTEAPAQW